MNEEEKALEFVEVDENDDEEAKESKGKGLSHMAYLGIGALGGAALFWAGGKAKNFIVEKVDAHKAKKAVKEQAEINAIEPDYDDDFNDEVKG